MVTFILLIFILGVLIFVHELGHFLAAKKAGVHIYEFALGFGPKLWSKVGKKDKIIYSIRMLPIGGFVQMAGEVYEDDNKIPKSKFMCNKPWLDRIMVMSAGVFNNFVLAIILLFVFALSWGYTERRAIVGSVSEGFPAAAAGVEVGDQILAINGKSATTWDMFTLRSVIDTETKVFDILIRKTDGSEVTYKLEKQEHVEKDGTKRMVFGIDASDKKYGGFTDAIKFAFGEFSSIMGTMWFTITGLFSGTVSLKNLAGPVGMYSFVGEAAKIGISSIIYLMALLSINLGFINFLPFPAFDGGRVFFLIIEKIIGRPINRKFENTMHTIFFILLMMLMLYITVQDIIRLF